MTAISKTAEREEEREERLMLETKRLNGGEREKNEKTLKKLPRERPISILK